MRKAMVVARVKPSTCPSWGTHWTSTAQVLRIFKDLDEHTGNADLERVFRRRRLIRPEQALHRRRNPSEKHRPGPDRVDLVGPGGILGLGHGSAQMSISGLKSTQVPNSIFRVKGSQTSVLPYNTATPSTIVGRLIWWRNSWATWIRQVVFLCNWRSYILTQVSLFENVLAFLCRLTILSHYNGKIIVVQSTWVLLKKIALAFLWMSGTS